MISERLTNRLRRAGRVVHASLFVIALIAILLGLANVTRFRPVPEDERVFGFTGSVKGRLFESAFAAGHFTVGASGSLRINLDNFSNERYKLILRTIPRGDRGHRELDVPPGLTRLELHPGRGPVYLEFRWNRPPRGVILNTVQSSEYRRFKVLMYALLGLAGFAGLFFFVSAVDERTRGRKRAPTAVFFFLFAAYFFVFENALIPLTGDEPHYLVLAESLVRDADLRVENNYESIWRHLYYPGAIDRHTTPTPHGDIASHYPLLSLLLTPALAGAAIGLPVDPYTGGKLIAVLLAALTGALVFARVLRVTRRGWPRFCAGSFVVVLFLSLPLLAYSNQLFPELPAGLLLFFIVSSLYDRSLRPTRAGRPAPGGGLFRMTIPIVLLPWANLKFALPALFCGLYLLWLARGAPRRFFFTGFFLGAGALAISLFNLSTYGHWQGPYAGQAIVTRDFALRYATYLFDADRGLFALQPLYFWAAPGLALFWRRSRPFVLLLLAVLIGAHLPNIFQEDERNWLLGYCPAGRYWVAVAPLLVWCGARGVAGIVRWPRRNRVLSVLRATAIALSLPGFLIGLVQSAAFLDFQEGYYLPLGATNNAARYLLKAWSVDLPAIFALHPFVDRIQLEVWMLVGLLFVLLTLSMGFRRRRR